MASYNTIPKTEEEPLIADAPKASHKSTAVIAAVCLLSAVAGFNNQKIYNTLFYKTGQIYLNAKPDGKEVCMSVAGKEATNGAKIQTWDCDNLVGKHFMKKGGSTFQLEYVVDNKNSGYCVAGATEAKGFKDGSQFYLYECKSNDKTQQFSFARGNGSGRHLFFQENDELCITARGTSNGDKVEAKKYKDGNDYQKWAFAS